MENASKPEPTPKPSTKQGPSGTPGHSPKTKHNKGMKSPSGKKTENMGSKSTPKQNHRQQGHQQVVTPSSKKRKHPTDLGSAGAGGTLEGSVAKDRAKKIKKSSNGTDPMVNSGGSRQNSGTPDNKDTMHKRKVKGSQSEKKPAAKGPMFTPTPKKKFKKDKLAKTK